MSWLQSILIAEGENIIASEAGAIVALAGVPQDEQADGTAIIQNAIKAIQTRENIGQILTEGAPYIDDILTKAIATFANQNDPKRLGLVAFKGMVKELVLDFSGK